MTITAMKRTTLRKRETTAQRWHVVDAQGVVVGRLASRLAMVLMGKHRPDYTPHVDSGDFVIVLNCDKVRLTGNKWNDKIYRHHSGYIGGLKEVSAARMLKYHPDRILRLAVQRMLPKGILGRNMASKLKIYTGTDHPHAAQQPQPLSV